MEQESDDLHLCLNCHVTVIGLQNYVNHRKSQCPVQGKTGQKGKPVQNVPQSTSSLSSETSPILCDVSTAGSIHSDANVKACLGNESIINPSTVSSLAVSLSTLDSSRSFLSPGRYPLELFTTEVGQQLQSSLFGSPVKTNSGQEVSTVAESHLGSNVISKSCSEPQQNRLKGDSEKKSHPSTDHHCGKNPESETETMPDAATVAEFFSSLELKVREPNDKHPCDLQASPMKTVSIQSTKEDPFEERLKSIKIANILTDLEFSSDSEGLPSDVEELLNFNDADIDESVKAMHGGKWKPSGGVAANHSRGKWRPGGKVIDMGKQGKKPGSGGKWKPDNLNESSGGKWKPENVPEGSGGKWRPGQRVVHGIGKHGKLRAAYKAYRGLTESEDEEDTVSYKTKKSNPQESGQTKPATIWCDECQKSFRSRYYLDKHKTTAYHKKHLKKAKSNSNKPSYKCDDCDKTFNNKYNFVRHLAAERHLNQIDKDDTSTETENQLNSMTRDNRNQPNPLRDNNMQILLQKQKPFQCQICSFFSDKQDLFTAHITSVEHTNKTLSLLGPLFCVRCKFTAKENQDLVKHVASDIHKETISKSDRPCVIKESRSNIPCQKCDKTLTSWVKLWQHLKSAHSGSSSDKPVRQRGRVNRPQCPYCDTRWQCEANLQVHIRRRHSGEKPFMCQACKLSFSSKSDLSRHFTSARHIEVAMQLGTHKTRPHPGLTEKTSLNQQNPPESISEKKKREGKNTRKLKQCKYQGCTFETSAVKELRDHYKTSHQTGHRFVCSMCGYGADHKSHWDKHCSSSKHLQLLKASEAREVGDSKSPESQARFICDACTLSFDTEFALHQHKTSHTVMSEKDLLRESAGDEMRYLDERYHAFVKSLPVEKDAAVQCRECGKETTRRQIVEHLRTHTSVTPFHCLYCDKSFQRGERLKAHLQIHFPKKWHLCDHCPSKYRALKSLRQHIITHHPQHVDFQIDYMCSSCGYKCMSSTSFRIHMTTHLGNEQKRFRCPWKGCKKRFQYKSALNYHLRYHRKEKPYLCDQCGFAAIDRQHLNRHKRKHTGIRNYKCEYCTYSYFNSSGLRRHMRLHINAKPFRCPYPEDCQFRANSLEHIRKHVNFNSKHVSKGEHLYPCRRCEKGYRSQAELREHVTSEHHIELSHKETSICGLHPRVVQRSLDLKAVPAGQKVNQVQEQFVAKKWRQTAYNEGAYNEGIGKVARDVQDSEAEEEDGLDNRLVVVTDIQ